MKEAIIAAIDATKALKERNVGVGSAAVVTLIFAPSVFLQTEKDLLLQPLLSFILTLNPLEVL